MYSVKNSADTVITSAYIEACRAASRSVSVKCIFSGSVTYDGQYLISMEFSEVFNTDSNNIIMGATPSQSVKIKMFMPDERISLDGGYLEPFAGLEVAGEMVWLPLGRFYVTDVTTADDYKTVEITAYDKMNSLEETYVPIRLKCRKRRIICIHIPAAAAKHRDRHISLPRTMQRTSLKCRPSAKAQCLCLTASIPSFIWTRLTARRLHS
jgi:hypothetical protein